VYDGYVHGSRECVVTSVCVGEQEKESGRERKRYMSLEEPITSSALSANPLIDTTAAASTNPCWFCMCMQLVCV
jgi:hypothetical protein